MKQRITTLQAIVIVVVAIVPSSLFYIPSFVIQIAKQDGWISVLLALAVSLLLAVVIGHTCMKGDRQPLLKWLQGRFGKVISTGLGLVLCVYYFVASVAIVRQFSNFMSEQALMTTPMVMLAGIIVLVSVYIASQGIESLARVIFVVFLFFMFFVGFNILLIWGQFDFNQFLPIIESPPADHMEAMLMPLGCLSEISVLLLLTPYLEKPASAIKVAIWGTAISGTIFMCVTMVTIAVFGTKIIGAISYPAFAAIGTVEIGQFIERVDVLIAPGSARRILEQMMQISKISGDGIREINHLESKFTSVLPEVKLYQLAMNLASDSGSALLPEVFVAGNSDASSLKVFESTTLPAKIKLGRVAVIKKDKMVGWLSRKESLGVAFLRNDVKNTMLTFACPNEENKYLTLQISDSSTALQPSLEEEKMTVRAHIKGKAVLSQSDCSSMDLYKPEIVDALETSAEKDVQRFTNAGWKAAQRLQTDAVGFADMAHRKYRKQWREWKKDWDHYFSTIKLEVSAEITITNVGLSNQPIDVNKLREGKK